RSNPNMLRMFLGFLLVPNARARSAFGNIKKPDSTA
ncbi:MAG: hypothetical protein ACI9A8_001891, partial [Cryomorphaceae bacterium]